MEKLAEDQGIKDYKFTNQHGQAYQDADWIEGVMEDEDYGDEDKELNEEQPNQPFVMTYDKEYLPDQDLDEYYDEDDEEKNYF